jgi:uncharacterized protein
LKKNKQVRAVIDTNLFISGLFADKGVTCQLQEFWIEGVFELTVSESILNEIENTLLKPYIRKRLFIRAGDETMITDLIREKAFVVTPDAYTTDKITEDPADNKFLACALEAKANYIVSGDKHLLALKHFHGIQIVDAKAFVEIVSAKKR